MAKKVDINNLEDPVLIGVCPSNAPKEIIKLGTWRFKKYALVEKDGEIEKYVERSEVEVRNK